MHYLYYIDGGIPPVNLPPSIFMKPVSVVPSTPPPSSTPPLFPTHPSHKPAKSVDTTTGAPSDEIKYISQESKNKYEDTFKRISKARDGLVTGPEARDIFKLSKLPVSDLAHIWNLTSYKQSGFLNLDEFCLAMYLIESKMHGGTIPANITPGTRLVVGSAPGRSTTPDLGLPPSYDAIKVLDTQENEIKDLTTESDQLTADIQNSERCIKEKKSEIADIKVSTSLNYLIRLSIYYSYMNYSLFRMISVVTTIIVIFWLSILYCYVYITRYRDN